MPEWTVGRPDDDALADRLARMRPSTRQRLQDGVLQTLQLAGAPIPLTALGREIKHRVGWPSVHGPSTNLVIAVCRQLERDGVIRSSQSRDLPYHPRVVTLVDPDAWVVRGHVLRGVAKTAAVGIAGPGAPGGLWKAVEHALRDVVETHGGRITDRP